MPSPVSAILNCQAICQPLAFDGELYGVADFART
jgi:hypothetical protein